MPSPRARHLVSIFLILGAGTYLAFAGVSSNWVYYQDVDTLVRSRPQTDRHVRLHGTVATDEADIRPVDLYAGFFVQGQTERVRVEYRGSVPDRLRIGGEVVIEGTLDDQGIFRADVILTKCDSRHQSMSSRTSSSPKTP